MRLNISPLSLLHFSPLLLPKFMDTADPQRCVWYPSAHLPFWARQGGTGWPGLLLIT